MNKKSNSDETDDLDEILREREEELERRSKETPEELRQRTIKSTRPTGNIFVDLGRRIRGYFSLGTISTHKKVIQAASETEEDEVRVQDQNRVKEKLGREKRDIERQEKVKDAQSDAEVAKYEAKAYKHRSDVNKGPEEEKSKGQEAYEEEWEKAEIDALRKQARDDVERKMKIQGLKSDEDFYRLIEEELKKRQEGIIKEALLDTHLEATYEVATKVIEGATLIEAVQEVEMPESIKEQILRDLKLVESIYRQARL